MAGNANSGRRKLPGQVLQLHGRGPGKDSGGRDIPSPLPFKREAPEAPEWLSAEAQAEWGRILPGLVALDMLKAEDRAMLAAYCEQWATFVAACNIVAEQGQTIEEESVSRGPAGTTTRTRTIVNPFIAVARAAQRELRANAAHFGLSPSAELTFGKAETGGDGDENPFD